VAAPAWLAFLRRTQAACRAGRVLAPEDAARLGRAITEARAGEDIGAALRLPNDWRQRARRIESEEAAAALVPGAAGSEAVRTLRNDLARYARRGFVTALRTRREPDAEPEISWYRLLAGNGGRVPHEKTLARRLRP
jgi:hypothetical protein